MSRWRPWREREIQPLLDIPEDAELEQREAEEDLVHGLQAPAEGISTS